MTHKVLSLLALAAVSAAQLSACPQPNISYEAPLVADGFELTKLVDGLKHPRQVVIDSNHNLLVSSLGDGLIAYPLSESNSSCISAGAQKVMVPDKGRNFTHAVRHLLPYKTKK